MKKVFGNDLLTIILKWGCPVLFGQPHLEII
jgi:hypothetical protein